MMAKKQKKYTYSQPIAVSKPLPVFNKRGRKTSYVIIVTYNTKTELSPLTRLNFYRIQYDTENTKHSFKNLFGRGQKRAEKFRNNILNQIER